MLKKQLEESKNKREIPIMPTFSQMLQQPQAKTFTNKAIKNSQEKHTIFITSQTGENIKAVQEKFCKQVNPVKDRIKIKNMRSTNKVLIVETESKQDLEKIMNNQELAKELKVEPPRKRNPLMIIYDVQTNWTEDYIKTSIYNQNIKDLISKEDFDNGFTLKFKTGPREKTTVNHVAEVDPKVRKALLTSYKIYMGFYSLSIKDYIVVPRCLKCYDLGHVAKHCKEEEQNCSHCGGQKHQKAECPKKGEDQTCIPCQKRNKTCKEKGKECKTYKLMMERLIQKTNYGE